MTRRPTTLLSIASQSHCPCPTGVASGPRDGDRLGWRRARLLGVAGLRDAGARTTGPLSYRSSSPFAARRSAEAMPTADASPLRVGIGGRRIRRPGLDLVRSHRDGASGRLIDRSRSRAGIPGHGPRRPAPWPS